MCWREKKGVPIDSVKSFVKQGTLWRKLRADPRTVFVNEHEDVEKNNSDLFVQNIRGSRQMVLTPGRIALCAKNMCPE